jgi:DNA mismatch endonuclease (patch repair protein)
MVEPPISESRRRNMAAIKPKNTTPEVVVRQLLHALGLRFRLHDKNLPGRPDVVLQKHKTVVLVHGCFWHHHGCANSVWPQTRRDFWREKISGNRRRDRKNERALVRLGWRVITIWECEVRSGKAQSLLARQFSARKRSARGPKR